MKIVETLLIVIAILGFAHSAHAHGIAGNRFFPGTLSFDDPAVADESILPLFSSSKHPDEGATPSITGLPGLFFRLLTPTLGVGVDSGWAHREWGSSRSLFFHSVGSQGDLLSIRPTAWRMIERLTFTQFSRSYQTLPVSAVHHLLDEVERTAVLKRSSRSLARYHYRFAANS